MLLGKLPVFIINTIKVRITVMEKKDYKKPEYGLITEKLEAFNQHDELVMVCENFYQYKKEKLSKNETNNFKRNYIGANVRRKTC